MPNGMENKTCVKQATNQVCMLVTPSLCIVFGLCAILRLASSPSSSSSLSFISVLISENHGSRFGLFVAEMTPSPSQGSSVFALIAVMFQNNWDQRRIFALNLALLVGSKFRTFATSPSFNPSVGQSSTSSCLASQKPQRFFGIPSTAVQTANANATSSKSRVVKS